jgi:hypothetical protein
MPDAPTGPQVNPEDSLYRGITHPDWWDQENGRVRSAAFSFPCFSTDIASLTTVAESLARLRQNKRGCGLASFPCGAARELGFDARKELDEQEPDNKAHANVYCSHGSGARKKNARKLAAMAVITETPQFPPSDSA